MIIIRNLTINKFNFMVKLFKIIIKISPIIALVTRTIKKALTRKFISFPNSFRPPLRNARFASFSPAHALTNA